MNNNFVGKTVLLTGASSGLGQQMCINLLKVGARVILTARSLDKLEVIAQEFSNAVPMRMDIADKDSVNSVFSQLEQQKEKIDICINNAGVAMSTPIFEPSDDCLEQMFRTNVLGTWYVTKAAAIHMKNHKIAGSIINIGSVSAENCLSETMAGYSASKAAIKQLTRALTSELAEYSIRINCIQPGLFITEKNRESRMQIIQNKEFLKKLIPLNYIAEPSELDAMVLFLASNEASRYVTGACFTIDGGLSWGGK